jgi:uncharacterized membrane-anchored protein
MDDHGARVPEPALLYWAVTIAATMFGDTAADVAAIGGSGLTGSPVPMVVLLAAALVTQLWSSAYVPIRYWTVVLLMSVAGTWGADGLTERAGPGPVILVLATALAAAFAAWLRFDRPLAVRTITTRQREGLHWLVLLATIVLGTAIADLVAEELSVGPTGTSLMFGLLVASVALLHLGAVSPVLTFWAAIVLTRPFGDSIGDLLTVDDSAGGLGVAPRAVAGACLTGALLAAGWFTVRVRRRPPVPA